MSSKETDTDIFIKKHDRNDNLRTERASWASDNLRVKLSS